MVRIGLTGGIGSGKSTVAAIFEVLGIPVYYSDLQARRLLLEDPELKSQIQLHFGAACYAKGTLDRAYLSRQVFNNSEKLTLLNSLVHPVTIRDANHWMQQQRSPYVIKEAALIFESGSDQYLDYVVEVYAPLSLRIQRAMTRDHVSEAEVLSRVNSQMDEKEKIDRSDFVLYNDDQQAVLPQVLELHQEFLQLAGK
jgi:dephospho-CoA kinase